MYLFIEIYSRTITALRVDDRINVIHRLINKTDYSRLLLAYVFYDLLNFEHKFECEMFLDYFRQLIDKHSSESIVFDLLKIYCQKNENHHTNFRITSTTTN